MHKLRKAVETTTNAIDDVIDEVLARGAVPQIVSFLARDEDKELQIEAAWVLTNLVSATCHVPLRVS